MKMDQINPHKPGSHRGRKEGYGINSEKLRLATKEEESGLSKDGPLINELLSNSYKLG
jgi:hypothetical protein